MKKVISLSLILVLVFTAIVPSFAVGESFAISGFGAIASSFGLTSVWPVVGAMAVLLAGGLIITQTNVVPVLQSFFSNVFSPSMEQELSDIGTATVDTVSADVIQAVSDFKTLNIESLPNSISTDISTTFHIPSFMDFSAPSYPLFTPNELQATNIPGYYIVPKFFDAGYSPYNNVVIFIVNLITRQIFCDTFYVSQYNVDVTVSLGVDSDGLLYETFTGVNYRPTTTKYKNFSPALGFSQNQATLESYFGYPLSNVSNGNDGYYHETVIPYPSPGFTTTATSLVPDTTTSLTYDDEYTLTDQTVISVPTTWTYDDDDDVFSVPDVGILTPGLVIPSTPAGTGSISWDASPEWQDDSPDLPTWTYRIPLLGTIVRFLSWIGSLIKALGNWLSGLWDSISGFFADVRQFFADFRQFVIDLFDLLRGSDLAQFLASILSFLSGYTLYQGLFSAFLPQCIAVVLWAGWLVIMAFWVLRLILNR